MECLICRETKRENLIRLTSSNILGFLDPLVSICDLLNIDSNFFHELKLSFYCNVCHAEFDEVMQDLRELRRLEHKLTQDRIRIEGKIKNSIKRTRRRVDEDYNQNLRKKIIDEITNLSTTSFQNSQSSNKSDVSVPATIFESSSDVLDGSISFDASEISEIGNQGSEVSLRTDNGDETLIEMTETPIVENSNKIHEISPQSMMQTDEIEFMDYVNKNETHNGSGSSFVIEDNIDLKRFNSSNESFVSNQPIQENGATNHKGPEVRTPQNKFRQHSRSRSTTPTRLIPFLPLLPLQIDKDVESTMADLLNGVVAKNESDYAQEIIKCNELTRRLSSEDLCIKFVKSEPTVHLKRLCKEAITRLMIPLKQIEVDLNSFQACLICHEKLMAKRKKQSPTKCPQCKEEEETQKSFLTILEMNFLREIDGKQKFVCDCNSTFDNLIQLREHLIRNYRNCEDAQWSCSVCSLDFIAIVKLRQKKPLLCQHCYMKFVSTSDLRSHVINVHATVKNVSCNNCASFNAPDPDPGD